MWIITYMVTLIWGELTIIMKQGMLIKALFITSLDYYIDFLPEMYASILAAIHLFNKYS